MRRWRNGLTVASVILMYLRPFRALSRMRSDARGYPWWPGSKTLPSTGRIQMCETNYLQIVISGLHRTAGPYKVHGAKEGTAIAGLEDLSAQSCGRHCGDGPVRRPDDSFRLLYGLLILRHDRREILWLGVTAHPTAEWIASQLTEACGWEQGPRYLIRDRDSVYGDVFIRRLRAMGIRDRPIARRSPWQNGYWRG